MNKYLTFALVYLTLNHILILLEYDHYIGVVEKIQMEPWDVTSTLPIILRTFFLYILIFGSVLYIIFKYIYDKASLTEAFIFGSFLGFVWDGALLSLFYKSWSYLPVLLYDIFIATGACLVLSLFIVRNYDTFLSKNSPYLFLLFFSTFIYFFYYSYTDTQRKLKLQEAKAKAHQ